VFLASLDLQNDGTRRQLKTIEDANVCPYDSASEFRSGATYYWTQQGPGLTEAVFLRPLLSIWSALQLMPVDLTRGSRSWAMGIPHAAACTKEARKVSYCSRAVQRNPSRCLFLFHRRSFISLLSRIPALYTKKGRRRPKPPNVN
jgi:hypothetical protein